MSSDIDITNIPSALAERLGCDVFTAGLICSAVLLIFTVCLVAFVIKKGSALLYGVLVTEFVVMGALVALTWLPIWILVVATLAVALMFAGAASNWLS